MKSYYMFVASLPTLPRRFDAGPIPITAAKLRSRLDLLDDQDQEVLGQLSDFFRWDRQPIDRSDAEVVARHRQLTKSIRNPLVQQLVQHRFEMRMLVVAIRTQRAGLPPPLLPDLALAQDIRRNWEQPQFHLNTRIHWLERFCKAFNDQQPQQAQRVLFEELWSVWNRLNEQYHFAFESIVLYLARWEILYRWASQNAELGKQRFDSLVDGILATLPSLTTPSTADEL